MKKTLKTIMLSLILAVCLAFSGCGVSQSMADKINDAAKKGEPMSVTDVMKRLGDDPAVEALTLGTGVLIYVQGCDDWEDVEEKLNRGENMKAIIITCLAGDATGAVYNDNYKGEKK